MFLLKGVSEHQTCYSKKEKQSAFQNISFYINFLKIQEMTEMKNHAGSFIFTVPSLSSSNKKPCIYSCFFFWNQIYSIYLLVPPSHSLNLYLPVSDWKIFLSARFFRSLVLILSLPFFSVMMDPPYSAFPICCPTYTFSTTFWPTRLFSFSMEILAGLPFIQIQPVVENVYCIEPNPPLSLSPRLC